MQINVTFDSSVSLAPAGFVAAVNYVVNYYDQLFPNPVTISIHVGYGEINGQALSSSALGESEHYLTTASYSSVRNALLAANAPAASTLPATAPAGSPGQLYISLAEATALGLAPNNGSLDGYVGFSSISNIFSYSPNTAPLSSQYYFIGVVEHEFSEVMGRASYLDLAGAYSPMDLLRYSAPGVHQFTTGAASYFSIDGGTTNLDNWNNFQTGNGGDLGDWAPSAGNDAFNDNSNRGVINAVTSADLTLMNALGWGVLNAGVGLPNAKVTVGDFSGDGKTDIAMTGQGLGGIDSYVSNGNGTFHAVYSTQAGADWIDWPTAKVISGDFNGDGKTDIAVTASGLGGIGSYLSNGDGTFHSAYSSQTGSDWVDWPTAKVITGDFSGDGKTDIAVTTAGLGGIGSYLSNGDGTFHAAYSSQTGADWVDWPTAKVITGDFSGDGKTDIAVTASGLGGIGSYLSNGDGTFHAAYSSQTGADWVDWPSANVITGDFNGDGKTDIAVSAPGLGGIGSYLSNGDGTFHAAYSSQTGADWVDWSGAKTITGDFNGDGKTDIAVTAPGLNGISVYLSNGDGTFDAIFSPQAVSSLTGTSLSQPGAAIPAEAVAPASGNVFVGSPGNDVLTGTRANDTFVFAFGNTGHEIINNFQPSSDTIEFDNVNYTTFQQLQALMQPSGSDVVINLSASESVTLHGVTMDTLHASNFAILNHGILA